MSTMCTLMCTRTETSKFDKSRSMSQSITCMVKGETVDERLHMLSTWLRVSARKR